MDGCKYVYNYDAYFTCDENYKIDNKPNYYTIQSFFNIKTETSATIILNKFETSEIIKYLNKISTKEITINISFI